MRKQAKKDIEMRKLTLSFYRRSALAWGCLLLMIFPQPIMAVWNAVPFLVDMTHDIAEAVAAFAAVFFGMGLLTEKYEPIIWEGGAPIKTPRVIKRLRRNFSRR